MRGVRSGVVAGLVSGFAVVLLAACGGGSDDAGSPAAATLATASSTSSPSTTAVVEAEDFDRILRALLARRDEAYERNDISILEEIYDDRCECLLRAREVIADRIAEGVHTSGERLRVISTEVFSRTSPDLVFVRAVVEQGPNDLVDARGEQVRSGEEHGPMRVVYELGRSSSTWRIFGILPEGPA